MVSLFKLMPREMIRNPEVTGYFNLAAFNVKEIDGMLNCILNINQNLKLTGFFIYFRCNSIHRKIRSILVC